MVANHQSQYVLAVARDMTERKRTENLIQIEHDLGITLSALSDLQELTKPMRGVIVANELLDNLPMRLAARAGNDWEERWVGVEGAALSLVAVPVRPDT